MARLTARAADRLGLGDRGRIEPGKRADLVLLDPGRYVDTAPTSDPRRSRTASSASGSTGPGWTDGAPTGADGAASCAARPQPAPNSRRPSATQDSVSVGSASFENGVCHTW